MRTIFWLLIPILLWNCQSDPPPTDQGTDEPVPASVEQNPEPAAAETASPATTTPAASTPASAEKPAGRTTEPIIGSKPPQPPTEFDGSITISGEQLSAVTGEEICQNVQVADFQQVISMQYSMQWDPAILSFVGLRDLGLPFLTDNNFGKHRTADGLLTFVWIDNSLKGVDLPDGSTIYQVCFEVEGKTGQTSPFRITGDPTPFEAVNVREKLVRIDPGEGSVTVK